MSTTRREAKDTKYRLRAAIARAEKVRHRCLEQLADDELSPVVHGQARANLERATGVVEDLGPSLVSVERWLDDDLQDRRLSPEKFDMKDR